MKYKNIYIWSSIERFGTSGISFLGNIILARLLVPEDFGLIGMVAVFFSIAGSFADCGLSDGLIQMENPQRKDYSTVFLFNLSTGTSLFLLFYIIAVPVSAFFDQPKLILAIRLLGISVLFSALTYTEETRLRKLLKTKELAIVKLSSIIAALGVSVFMAFSGYGYLSLVFLQILFPAFTLLFFTIVSHWRPSIYFDKQTFKKLFGFGQHLFITYFSNQIGRNMLPFVLGKLYSPAVTGNYTQAQKLQETPMLIVDSILCNTSYPVLMNEKDKNKREKMSVKLFIIVVLVNGLLVSCLYSLAPYIIQILYGAKWEASIPIFRVLLLYGFFYAIRSFLQTMFKVCGKVKLVKQLSLGERVLQIIILIITIPYDLYIIIYGQILMMVISASVHGIVYSKLKRN